MVEKEELPDHLRCHRNDGRRWRCRRRAIDGLKLCEIHHIQGKHRANKERVPESLKLERKPNSQKIPSQNPNFDPTIRAQGKNPFSRSPVGTEKCPKKKRKRNGGGGVDLSEALDETLKKMKLKRGDLQLDLIRVFLQRKVEKKKEKELLMVEKDEDLMKELPFGIMSILQSPVKNDNAASVPGAVGCNVANFEMRRCFRSKNIEPEPISTIKLLPCVKSVLKNKKKCHWCRKSSYRILIRCSSCRKQVFCEDCILERNFDKQDIKKECPVCRGTCRCKTCSMNQTKGIENKEVYRIKVNNKIRPHLYLIHVLLPVLEQINQENKVELEIEAKIKGVELTELQIQLAEAGSKLQHCCYCNIPIADVHRSCNNCSYALCLSCCQELRQGQLNGEIWTLKSVFPVRLGDFSSVSRNWKVCDDGSISCPPKVFGGCAQSVLDLKCLSPFNWSKELEASAKNIASRYDFEKPSDVHSCCSECRERNNKDEEYSLLRGFVSNRVLFSPTRQELKDGNLEHFQRHWGNGHPVLLRNVLKSSSDLSWDPVAMFCNYLERSANSQKNKDPTKAANCLDWCEVEISMKQIFMGSLEGRTHATVSHENLKFKVWLSSCVFQEQFPSHYAELIRYLTLQDYINPLTGTLNLAVKFPLDIPKPDLGPCIYISYGAAQELMQDDFSTKLCYNSYDVVDVLAQCTDLPISEGHLTNIKQLISKYKMQNHGESPSNTFYQQRTSEINRKSSTNSEETQESELQDPSEEEFRMSSGIRRASVFSADSHEHCSEFDSEASVLCSGTNKSNGNSVNEDVAEDDLQSPSCLEDKLVADSYGAQWDIFCREDVPKLEEYVNKHSDEFYHPYCSQKKSTHSILDQSFFLDEIHKLRLKLEYNVEPWTFKQHIGEAVMIPAGCPYQIRKLKSCVNVVLEFMSPENASECVKLNDELRLLPQNHKAKGKMREIKKMTLHAVSSAIEEIHSQAE